VVRLYYPEAGSGMLSVSVGLAMVLGGS
jgi:hypothetical protein